jgi:hypothetical protein
MNVVLVWLGVFSQVEASTIDEPPHPSRAEKKKVIEELLETPEESAERKHAIEELENAAVREDALLAAERKEAEEILEEAIAKARKEEVGSSPRRGITCVFQSSFPRFVLFRPWCGHNHTAEGGRLLNTRDNSTPRK